MKIMIIGTLPSSLINFRGELLEALLTQGHRVIACASGATGAEIKRIESLGVIYRDFSVSRSGLNILEDLQTFRELYCLFRKERPDIILSYTIKPIVWGGLASYFSGAGKFYGLITGLGYSFQKGNILKNVFRKFIIALYRVSLRKSSAVIFQNRDNLEVFVENNIVPKEKVFIVNGSGVDLNAFEVTALPKGITFLLIARLLKDKGIVEFLEAGEMVKLKFPNVKFKIVGPTDPSPNSISVTVLKNFQDKGVIEYLGGTSDVRPYINDCSVFVLPSYHEGMPRTVLEAMATGRPILTTNVPGCKETVMNGRNGWLVEKANVEQLAERMIWFIEHPGELKKMSDESRLIAMEKFDVHKVNNDLLRIMRL